MRLVFALLVGLQSPPDTHLRIPVVDCRTINIADGEPQSCDWRFDPELIEDLVDHPEEPVMEDRHA